LAQCIENVNRIITHSSQLWHKHCSVTF